MPRDECLAHDQAAGGKDPTSIGGSRHLYDYLGGAPVDPRGTLSEGGVYHGAGDQWSAGDHGLSSSREPDKPSRGPPTQVEEPLFGFTGPLLEWARTGVRPEARRGSSYICRPDSSHPAGSHAAPKTNHAWTSYQGEDSRRPNLKAQVYDGSKPLAEYLSHFQVVAAVNWWSEYEKGLYEELLRALADSIEVAVEKVYPQADPDTTNQLCMEYLEAVKDPQVRQWVHTRGPYCEPELY